jgi:hypothetical protein
MPKQRHERPKHSFKSVEPCQDEHEAPTLVGLIYWALADARREAPWFGPKTTTVAPVFTRL